MKAWPLLLAAVLCHGASLDGALPDRPSSDAALPDAAALSARLVPQPQRLEMRSGFYRLRGEAVSVDLPTGAEHEACRTVIEETLRSMGAAVSVRSSGPAQALRFTLGAGCATPPLPTEEHVRESYCLAVAPDGISAVAASPAGLLYAAQTLRQLARVCAHAGRLPALIVVDQPAFAVRGIYIEGGQERHGRIVDGGYLREQVRRLSALKMNTLVVECYNLFPYASFPACADDGTLPEADCRALVAEARRYHVTIVPSLQTLAQAGELVWGCDAGKPFREPTAPGQMCPSTPEIYPMIKGLYRDLLRRFDQSSMIGIGCSEIDMQWQGRYCPKCRQRVAAGANVRDLLLGHAEQCIRAVHELASELKRPVRPLIWADEFYMYGLGKDWVGIDRIPRDTVMGYWKYWSDYQGIGGLMDRGYDVLGISAIYNHTFYLADLSPQSPRKAWAPMEQTGVRNIVEMVQEAAKVRNRLQNLPRTARSPSTPVAPVEGAPAGVRRPEFLGVATASFSKHRLRAFDSLWYGFALNGQTTWSFPKRPLPDYQAAFTRAWVQHEYDCRTDAAAEVLAAAWNRLDACKSQLELANQTLHDVVGVYDTQEPGYQGNTLLGALGRCREHIAPSGQPREALQRIRSAAMEIPSTVEGVRRSLLRERPSIGDAGRLDELLRAAEKIAAHAQRQTLLIDTQALLTRAPSLPPAIATAQAIEAAARWNAHRARAEAIARDDAPLYRRGDPCGHAALLRDVGIIATHLANVGRVPPSGRTADVLLDERFERLDAARWIVLGKPRIVGGRLETSVSGGWENRCGIATRMAFPLEDTRPLVVEFTLTPIKMGIDSQIFAAATEAGIDAYRFSFYGPANRFAIYTQSANSLTGPWQNHEPGWRPRAESGPMETGRDYRVRAEIRRSSFRIVVRAADGAAWDVPLWDSGETPMDPLESTRLRFADVEPEGGSAASRWANIRVERPR